MFFHNIILRRLSSLLRPWLQEEPNPELKLGITSSRAIVQNLRLDVSVLNELLDDTSQISFEEIVIEQLSVCFSAWSAPAFSIEVRGIHVTLSARVMEGSSRRVRTSLDATVMKMKKALSSLDPEGCSLHDFLEKMLFATSSRNQIKTSLLNLILGHCHIKMINVDLQLRFPSLRGLLAYSLKISELKAESQGSAYRFFLMGILGAILVPLNGGSFFLGGSGFEVGYERNGRVNSVSFANDVSVWIKTYCLQLVNLTLCVPELSFLFCPSDLPVFLELEKLSSKADMQVRSGRQLWNLAAARIGYLTSSPRLSLQNLVSVVILWLKYVNAYENLLISIDYSSDKLLKSSIAIIYKSKAYLSSAKQKWDMICNIEKALPAEAVAQARRVARHRARLTVQHVDYNHRNCFSFRSFRDFSNIFSVLAFIWIAMSQTFHSIAHVYFSRKKLTQDPQIEDSEGIDSVHSCPEFQLAINFPKVSITFYPDSSINPVKLKHLPGFPLSDFLSTHLSVDKILLMYAADVSERSISICCGKLKVKLSDLGPTTSRKSGTKNMVPTSKDHKRMSNNNLKTILYTEPASQVLLSERNRSSSLGSMDGARHLENFLIELWSDWERGCLKFEDSEIEYSENPCLLFEIKSFLRYQDEDKQDSGFWKCSLVMGKLNVALGYTSMLSNILLLRRIQCAQDLSTDGKVPGSHSPYRDEDSRGSGWDEKYEFYTGRIKTDMLSLLPEKHVQFAIFVAGPHLEIAADKGVENEDTNYMLKQGNLQLVFDLHDIEFAVWPISNSDVTELKSCSASDSVEQDGCWFQKLHIIDIPESYNEKYSSHGWICLCLYTKFHGLNALICNKEENQLTQIFVLKSITLQSLSLRGYLYSFSMGFTALSTALNGVATGVSINSRIDDLDIFFQLILGSFSATSNSVGDLYGQELMREDTVMVEHENDEAFAYRNPLIHSETLFVINATFTLKSMDVILENSGSNNKLKSLFSDPLSSKQMACQDLADSGIWSSVLQVSLEIYYEEETTKFVILLSEFQSRLYRNQDDIQNSSDHRNLRSSLPESHNCLCELRLSSCDLMVCVDHPKKSSFSESDSGVHGDSTTMGNTSYALGNPSMGNEAVDSGVHSHSFIGNLESASHCALNIAMSEVFIASSSTKNVLLGAHQPTKLLSSLYFGRSFQSISWETQGGLLLLEPVALVMFLQGFSSYLSCLASISSILHSAKAVPEKAENSSGSSEQNDRSGYGDQTLLQSRQVKRGDLEVLSVNVSRFTLGFVGEDEAGVRELLLEFNVQSNLESSSIQRKFVFELSRLSILSQILKDDKNEINIPHFSSLSSSGSSSISGVSVQAIQHGNAIRSFNDAGLPRDLGTQESAVKNYVPREINQSNHNKILKNLVVLVSIEKSEHSNPQSSQAWVGSGSVSGFDLTVSISDLRVILSMFSSFSGLSSGGATNHSPQRHWSSDHEPDECLGAAIPDGALVAIQDVQQHLYVTVEGRQDNYKLGGVLHYSLMGTRGLFKIKYHKQRRWKSSVVWFSLTSLYAKTSKGEPLQLSYRPGSSFVDICGTDGNASTLWRMLSCEFESYKGDIDWEPYSQLVKHTFYLVNKKNDCGVAFLDGFLEFVKKPGNPFKLKLFCDVAVNACSPEPTTAVTHPEGDEGEEKISVEFSSVPCIIMTVEEASFTIVHELLETKDRLPLLRGSVDITQLIVQILPTKARIMSTSKASLFYFAAQKDLWRDFIHPIEVSTFYRSNFRTQSSENSVTRMPVRIYCAAKKCDVSLTELSLDILLFGIGKLDLAGPFLVKSSTILANCCKVENHSGLNLLCYVNEKQNVTISRKQSASFFLRHSEAAVSIQLSLGKLTTSSILLSLLEARTLAWRTRIVSQQDPRSYPGPFIVVDISKRSEDGLSMAISPLTRIHNETEFSMDLCFQRPDQKQNEHASVVLKPGDTVDDSMAAFNAANLSGGVKKVLKSLAVGNFVFSFRPEASDDIFDFQRPFSVEWSEEIKGGKPVLLSGIFDKLSYGVRSALSIESMQCSFSTAYCAIKSEDVCLGSMHFLIERIGRNVPIIQPEKPNELENQNQPIALIEQKDIYILPTMRVSNLLPMEIVVLLTETDQSTSMGCDNTGKRATIKYGATVDFYVNPAIIYFGVTLRAFGSSCKLVNSGEWVKKLRKHKNDAKCLDVELEFSGGKYYALLRLSRGIRGVLEAAVFSLYTLKNDTDYPLLFFAPNQKPLSREDVMKMGANIPPDLGLYLPPKTTQSWFLRSHKVRVKFPEGCISKALLDLGALSGLTEMALETEDECGVKYITKFGLSVRANPSKTVLPSQIVTIVPRHLVLNESKETIIVRQCYLEDDSAGMISIKSGQGIVLQLRDGTNTRREFHLFEYFIRKHGNDNANLLIFIQFRLNEPNSAWSGPLCITSIGRFFLKFKRESKESAYNDNTAPEFASVTVVEEGSILTVRFQKPSMFSPPYRIENCLRDASLTYYQKDSSELEVLQPGCCADYVWDDTTLPHRLVVLINDMLSLREIRLDKVRPWKPFFSVAQRRGFTSELPLKRKSKDQRTDFKGVSNTEAVKLGYEVYAEGPTRVLRISEFSGSQKGIATFHSRAKIQVRVSCLAIHLLELRKQDVDKVSVGSFVPILVARLENIGLDSVFSGQQKYNQMCIQSINVDYKWEGAPFAAMLRRHRSDSNDVNDCLLKIVFFMLSSGSNVTQIRYSSIILQPVDLNLDEETLMRIVPFWRKSLSNSSSASRQFYFDHFEIHPVKIITNFLPGDSFSSYNSAQETLRSLLHSVVKVPPIKNMVVELNGVLVTHALITVHELLVRCAQHYSWYSMRAIYIAKGSPLLPPAFASIFDDLASSSLDAFFDPSRSLMNLPGMTLGTFKLLSKCIDTKGFSGTRRYFGDLGQTLRKAGSNVLFAAVTEISDSILKGAETKGFDGVLSGFHQGVLKLAMEPSLLGTALLEGGPDRTIKLDRGLAVDELYTEGYIQAMLDTNYRQEYMRVKVIDDQVYLKNLLPNNALINEIMDHVKEFLMSKGLLRGDPSMASRPLRRVQGEREWKFRPTMLTLCEHLFVSYAIQILRKQAGKFITGIKPKKEVEGVDDSKAVVPAKPAEENQKVRFVWRLGIGKFIMSGIIAYIDGRLCRCIPNPIARRIVSGFLLSFLDKTEDKR